MNEPAAMDVPRSRLRELMQLDELYRKDRKELAENRQAPIEACASVAREHKHFRESHTVELVFLMAKIVDRAWP
jgi:hypothetical protein